MNLIRVAYGKEDTPVEDREYHLEGQTAVGTIKEFKEMFPKETFLIFEGTELMNTIEAGDSE